MASSVFACGFPTSLRSMRAISFAETGAKSLRFNRRCFRSRISDAPNVRSLCRRCFLSRRR